MGEFEFDDDIDFDACAELEWGALAQRLEGRLSALKREEFVEIARTDTPSEYQRLLSFGLTGSGRVRCTIDGAAFIGWAQREQRQVVRVQRAAVAGLGWRELRGGKFVYEVGKRGIPELVAVVIRSLRYVWEIAYPYVLTVHDPSGPASTGMEGNPIGDGVMPRDPDHLLELACQVLSEDCGEPLEIYDKAIRFQTADDFVTKVLVSPHALRLEFCTILSHGTPDMDLLGAVVAEHSSRWPEVSIVVTKGHVFAVRAMEAAVFHPENLLEALTEWLEFCADGAVDIVEQFHPEVLDQPESQSGEVPIGLVEMIARYRDDPTATTPDSLMRRYRANAPMLRRYARICAEMVKDWTAMEQLGTDLNEPVAEVERCRNRRREVEQFLPVLLEAINLAAERNVNWAG